MKAINLVFALFLLLVFTACSGTGNTLSTNIPETDIKEPIKYKDIDVWEHKRPAVKYEVVLDRVPMEIKKAPNSRQAIYPGPDEVRFVGVTKAKKLNADAIIILKDTSSGQHRSHGALSVIYYAQVIKYNDSE